MMDLDTLFSYIARYEYFVIAYLFVANSSYLVLLVFGFMNSRRKFLRSVPNRTFLNDITDQLKPISILVPAYNEAETVVESVNSLLKIDYPQYEIIVINDGSKDGTLEKLMAGFNLKKIEMIPPQILPTKEIKAVYASSDYGNLIVVDKYNGGKSDSLNAGIVFSHYPLVCCIDSDSLLDASGLIQLAYPFFEYPDEVVATGGTIRVVNGIRTSEKGELKRIKIKFNYLVLIQVVEYLRAFLVGRMGWDYLKANVIISGAFGLFSKKAVIDVGGYGTNTIGEDLELLIKIHERYLSEKKPYKVFFLPDPVCWTEVPESFKTLGNQRSRWQQGLAEGLFTARRMLFRPWAGRIGNLVLPYLLLFELISAPLELLGYIFLALGVSFGYFELHIILAFLAVSVLFGWILSLLSIIIEEVTFRKYRDLSSYFKLFLGVLLEQVGYHQIHLYWRLRGMYRFLIGKHNWGEMKRKGFQK